MSSSSTDIFPISVSRIGMLAIGFVLGVIFYVVIPIKGIIALLKDEPFNDQLVGHFIK